MMDVKRIRIKEVFLACLIFAIMFVGLWDFFAPSVTLYEAENAKIVGARFANKHPGYTGTGYVDYKSKSDEYIQWTVDVSRGGPYRIIFRYALGGKYNRPLKIIVNGETVDEGLAIPRIGDWDEWDSVDIEAILQQGENVIKAVSIGKSGPNIDSISLKYVRNDIFGFLDN